MTGDEGSAPVPNATPQRAVRALTTARSAITGLMAVAAARPMRTLRALGILVGVLALISAVAWYGVFRQSSVEQARHHAIAAAGDAVTALLSYNYQTIGQQVPSTQELLTGKFKSDYAQLVNTVLAPSAVKTQLLEKASVAASSVVSASPDHVVLLLFVNQQLQSNDRPAPETAGSRVRVTLDKQGGKWLVANLEPV
jgi:Mce-associated membrane protein